MHLNVDVQISINLLVVKLKSITDQTRLSKHHIISLPIFAQHCWLEYVGYNVS